MSATASTGDGPSIATILATDRTRLAHDRTLMAWVRTATSLISFGFTIYKFFQYMQEKNPNPPERLLGPRRFALLMIGTGIVALALATWQHIRDVRLLRAAHPEVPFSLAAVLAGLMSALGIIALFAVLFRQ